MSGILVPLAVLALLSVFSLAIFGHFQGSTLGAALDALRMPIWLSPFVVGAEASILVVLIVSPALGGILSSAFLVAVTAPFAIRAMSGEALPADCGCFGPNPAGGTRWLFLRNGALLALAAIVGAFGSAGLPAVAVTAGGGAGIASALLYRSTAHRSKGSAETAASAEDHQHNHGRQVQP